MYAQPINFLKLLNGQVQYVVPRWQRRYCWGQSDIERLVEDLRTVADAGPGATHYGGTLLTFPEPGAPGLVETYRVVDGQQRLTTVSILLGCIADELGEEGRCGDWTAQVIREHRLTNHDQPPRKHRKLRLQNGDEEEYRLGLEGRPEGAGAVAQAWRIARRLVARSDTERLLIGLERLRVVTIGLVDGEDPQQIFESLNATGRPLTESEKVKNWLLMGLPDEEQQELHDNFWKQIERSLGAEHASEPIDTFLRDFLRWRTGKLHGIDHAYEALRRWAVRHGHTEDRPALCRELTRLADLYGIVTGAAGEHPNSKVERELRHLREMGIDIHRPLTLRLLNDASVMGADSEDLARTLAGIGTWTTRMWLSDRPTAGMNKAMAELAHESGPGIGEDSKAYWLDRIRSHRNTRVGVPSDEEVQEGIRIRKAYGGSATRTSFAVLCALMEDEHREEAPARDHLTIEHVMPQTLTDDWKHALGDEAEDIHGRHRDRLSNLTLSGDVTNSGMGASTFSAKRQVYAKSSIGLTRCLADEDEWTEEVLEKRAKDLARRALDRWPWHDKEARSSGVIRDSATSLRWRIEDGTWHEETRASQMVLNVAGALLSIDPTNAERLSGDAIRSNLHPASRYAPGTSVGVMIMRGVPNHDGYVLYPYDKDYRASADRCRKMGDRCGVKVDVEFEEQSRAQVFWKYFKECTGGVPGQKDTWRGESQWTEPLNSRDDRIGIYVGSEWLWLYIRSGESHASEERTARLQRYAWMIQEQMDDQEVAGNFEKEIAAGRSVSIQKRWTRDDEDEWREAAEWLRAQHDRLRTIIADAERSSMGNEFISQVPTPPE